MEPGYRMKRGKRMSEADHALRAANVSLRIENMDLKKERRALKARLNDLLHLVQKLEERS